MMTTKDAEAPVQTALTPYLCAKDAARAIEFYARAFGAIVASRIDMPDGRVGHAELTLGGALVYLADEFPEYDHLSPETIGGSPVQFHLSVGDVDAFVARAVDAGATLVRAIADRDYGERSGTLIDPFGHRWTIASPLGTREETP
jgi:PhnB protein